MVGLDQIEAPAGPNICTPASFWRVGAGRAVMLYAFHRTSPLGASSATTLPRKVQQVLAEFIVVASSLEATGT